MGKRASCQSSPKDISDEKHKIKQLSHSSLLQKKVVKPKVYITESSSFKRLVQELTGNSASPSSPGPVIISRIIDEPVIVEDTFVPIINTALQEDNNETQSLEYHQLYSNDSNIILDQCNYYSSAEHHMTPCSWEHQSCFVMDDENQQAATIMEADQALIMDDDEVVIPVTESYTGQDQSLLQDYSLLSETNELFTGWGESCLGETAGIDWGSMLGGYNINNPDVESWLLDDNNTNSEPFPNFHCNYRATQNDSLQGLCI